MKTRLEVFQQTYLNRSDIAILLNVSRVVANRTYSIANAIDQEQLTFRTYPKKVRKSTVMKIHKLTESELLRQIKSTPETGQRTDVQKRKA